MIPISRSLDRSDALTPDLWPQLSRRSLLRATPLAGASAAMAPGLLLSPADAVGSMTTRRAGVVPNSFGVVVHLNWLDSAYQDHDELVEWLVRLGVRHVRSRLGLLPEVTDTFHRLSRNGIRVLGMIGELKDRPDPEKILRATARRFNHPRKVFSGFEGPNEPNNEPGAWIDRTRRVQAEMFNARAAHGLTGVPLLGPALKRVNSGGHEGANTMIQARNLGSMSKWVDLGNMHCYPRGLPPSADIGYFTRVAQHQSGSKPVITSEGGYFTAMNYSGPSYKTPASVAAAYGPQKILEHIRAGGRRSYRYEFLDDPVGADRNREASFGLISTAGGDWDAKPEFKTTRRLLARFGDIRTDFTPVPLAAKLVGGPSDLRHLAFMKKNGTHILALWLDRKIYDPESNRILIHPLTKMLSSVTIKLDRARDVKVIRILDGSKSKHAGVRQLEIQLGASVTLVKLAPR